MSISRWTETALPYFGLHLEGRFERSRLVPVEMIVRMRAPDDLKPFKHNARTHPPKQIEQIVASMRRFGFTNPILVTEDGEIIAGHGLSLIHI